MNLVFNRNNNAVVAMLRSEFPAMDQEEALKGMFPKQHQHLDVWTISKKLPPDPRKLQVILDEFGCPESLLESGRVIHQASKKDVKHYRKKEQDRMLSSVRSSLPKGVFESVRGPMMKIWKSFPYTSQQTKNKLQDLSYFSSKLIPISWWGTFVNAGGYANMNRSIVFRLHNHHIIPRADVISTPPQISPEGRYYISKYASLNLRRLKKYPRVYGFGPTPQMEKGGQKIFFTMTETETLHPEFVRLCNTYSDEVWVPSPHNEKVFLEGGVKKPIRMIPLGIDPIVYPQGEKHELGVVDFPNRLHHMTGPSLEKGLRSFRFVTLFGWSHRKGIDILVKSFVNAFSSKDDVALIFCSNHVGPAAAQKDILKYANMVRSKNHPQIIFCSSVTAEQDMGRLYRMGHVFINASRGEGFSLPQIEACAAGLPVISCNNTGMGQYLTEDNAYLIETDKQEVCSEELKWISPFYHGQKFPKLGSDQIDQASFHMKTCVNNYAEATEKGNKLRELIYQKYTWDHTADKVARRLREISS